MRILKTIGIVFALATSVASAHADTYSFTCISNGVAGACNDGVSNLTMDVTAGAGGSVDFTFRNFSTLSSSITEIYFDDGTLLGLSSVRDSGSGVTFSSIGFASPGNLPGGNSITPAFAVTAGFLVDTGNGGPSKGVENKMDDGAGNPQEFVTINFSLINGKTFADTLTALNSPLGDGNDLRVGLHVKSFSPGDLSASFINAAPVPEPLTVSLLLSGLALVGTAARRKA